MKQLNALTLCFDILLLSACSTTQITSTWKAPDAKAGTYNKIMVVGIIRESDQSMREGMETHLAGDLKAAGYNAVCACEEYGPKAFQYLTEEEVIKKLNQQGYDAVLTVVLLDKQKERKYVPGRAVHTPHNVYNGRFWGYYRSVYDRIETKGYWEETTNYFWESNLYDLTSQKLVYSIQTKSFDPASTNALAHEYGKMILQNMIKNGVLRKKTEQVAKAM